MARIVWRDGAAWFSGKNVDLCWPSNSNAINIARTERLLSICKYKGLLLGCNDFKQMFIG